VSFRTRVNEYLTCNLGITSRTLFLSRRLASFILRPRDISDQKLKGKWFPSNDKHPHLDIRLLFYRVNKDYARWAEKNGFRYAFCDIPKEWLDGL